MLRGVLFVSELGTCYLVKSMMVMMMRRRRKRDDDGGGGDDVHGRKASMST